MTRASGKTQLSILKDAEKVSPDEQKGQVAAEAGIKAARSRKKLNLRASGAGKRVERKPQPTARLKARAIFRYADGSFTTIQSSEGRLDALGLVPATDDNSLSAINGSVRALTPGKSKTMYFSYGYAMPARGGTRSRRSGKGAKRKVKSATGAVRKFSTIAVPSDANFDDCIAFANSWTNKPELIKLGKQQVKLAASAKPKAVTYNNAYGLAI